MIRIPRIGGTTVFLAAFGLDKSGRTVPVAAEKLRAFKGQMDLVMMKSTGR